ncbi:diguanylate cyclase [Rheinheimera sp.]|uniref:ligand-binding sensor domain-containing diguanylate cyclase n=1 Tax=Rheinheimera sp. TaxID=1869214 RepID=UPI003D27CA47
MPRIWLLCCYICIVLLQPAPALELNATPVEKLQNVPGIVYDVAQDQQDFLWLAAEYDGLLRFDGTEYLRFSPANAGPPFSYSHVVNDSQNNLWVATWGHGLWQLDPQRRHWRQVSAPVPADARIQLLQHDKAQNLWIGTTTGLYLLRANHSTAEIVLPLRGQRIWQLTEQSNGTLWVATSNGLYQFNPVSTAPGSWLQTADLAGAEIRAVAVHGDYLLIGRRAGIDLLDLRDGVIRHSSDLGNTNVFMSENADQWLVGSIDGLYRQRLTPAGLESELLLPAVDARNLYRDRQNNIWLSTRYNGIMRVPEPPLKSRQPAVTAFISPTQKHRLGPHSVTATARWQPLEKSLLQLKDGRWQELIFAPEYQVAYVRDVVEFAGQTLVGTDQGLYRYQPGAGLTPVNLPTTAPRLNIERMALASDDSLWLGLWEHGVYRIAAPSDAAVVLPPAVQLQTELQAQEGVIDIQQDAQQQLWLLSRHGKIYQGLPTELKLRWQPPANLATGYFHCLLAEADMFWLCTDRGLLRVSKDFSQADLLSLEHGLPDIRVIGITRTEQFIWVLTRNGVMLMRPDGSDIRLLSTRQELNLAAAQLRGIVALPSDQVQLATSDGLWQLAHTDLTPVPTNMQLHLTEFRLNQQLFSLNESNTILKLPERVQELQLKFRLLSFQRHLQVNYFFRWNAQQHWTAFGPEAVLTLSQLAPGRHQLEVMAQAGGQFIHTRPLQLDVPVPWWQRPAGIVVLTLAGSLLLYLSYRYRVNRLQQRAEKLDALVAERTQALEAANQQLQHLSNTDSLTGLLNRRALQYAAGLLQAQRSRHAAPLTLALLDIDHFKQINDMHGHDAGDDVLRQVATYLRQRLRSQDLLARWGGEEFLLLMPNTTLPQAQQLVDALRLGIRTLDTSPLDIALSATFGISPVATSALALEQAIKAADLALYQGKTQGRDQVVLAALPD